MDQQIRRYDEELDLDAVARIWQEVGWLSSLDKLPALKTYLAAAHTEVGLLADEAECMVQWAPGTIRYQATDLELCAITGVTTSHIGRKQGFASNMTARALDQGRASGCAVAALGMFEQGFYDLLGFGTATYDHRLTFDPSALMVEHVPYRPPVRITINESADIHQAMAGRMLSHGSVVVAPPGLVEGDIGFGDKPFALGYRDDNGTLTHFIYGDLKGEYGPWRIHAIAYQNNQQLLELLRLMRELSDQIRSVRIMEPVHVQLQALLRNPIRELARSERSDHESSNQSIAWWQLRILDLEASVAARNWVGEPVRFNLTLTDPLEKRLSGSWQGAAGDYTITIGAPSHATRGHTAGLPRLSAGVGSFTRLWFGVMPPSAIAVSDRIDAPDELLAALDDALLLPKPVPGWSF